LECKDLLGFGFAGHLFGIFGSIYKYYPHKSSRNLMVNHGEIYMTRAKFFVLLRTAWLVLLAAVISLLGTGGRPATVLAAGNTYTVNSTADLSDADLGDGLCLTSSGNCTLRAAIMQANYTAGADTIILPAGTYQLTRAGDDDLAVLAISTSPMPSPSRVPAAE
jgi:CSLREA domain-containing protein